MKVYLDASMEAVNARLAGRHRFNAPLAQQEELAIRTRRNGVRGVDGAPEIEQESE